MIGQTLSHTSGITGTVDNETIHPDGRVYVRINDHWVPADECGPVARGV